MSIAPQLCIWPLFSLCCYYLNSRHHHSHNDLSPFWKLLNSLKTFYFEKFFDLQVCAMDCTCVPLKFKCWSPNSPPQFDGIRSWGLWEIIRFGRWSLYEWDQCPYKGAFELSVCLSLSLSLSLSLPYEGTARRRCLQSRKWALTRHQICQRLDLGLLSLQNCEK